MAAYVSVEFSKVNSFLVVLDPFVCVMMSTVTYHDYMIIGCSLTHILSSLSKLPGIEETFCELQSIIPA